MKLLIDVDAFRVAEVIAFHRVMDGGNFGEKWRLRGLTLSGIPARIAFDAYVRNRHWQYRVKEGYETS